MSERASGILGAGSRSRLAPSELYARSIREDCRGVKEKDSSSMTVRVLGW